MGVGVNRIGKDSSFGILCITHTNLDAPWLNFEAGALSKSVDRSRVSPFLFGVKRSEIQGPILQFQSAVDDKDDVLKLLHSINNAGDEAALEEARLEQIFSVWWPKLEECLNAIEVLAREIPKEQPDDTPDQSQTSEILEEVLELLRSQHRLLNSPDELIPREYLEAIIDRSETLSVRHPAVRDLAKQWRDVRALLESFEEEDSIPMSVVSDIFGRLEDPVSYITKGAHMSRRGSSLRARREAEMQSLSTPE